MMLLKNLNFSLTLHVFPFRVSFSRAFNLHSFLFFVDVYIEQHDGEHLLEY